jgi:hypothetical protein
MNTITTTIIYSSSQCNYMDSSFFGLPIYMVNSRRTGDRLIRLCILEEQQYHTKTQPRKSLMGTTKIPEMIRFIILVMIFGTMVLLFSSHVSIGASVDLSMKLGQNAIQFPGLFEFSLGNTVTELYYKAGIYMPGSLVKTHGKATSSSTKSTTKITTTLNAATGAGWNDGALIGLTRSGPVTSSCATAIANATIGGEARTRIRERCRYWRSVICHSYDG